MATAAKLFGRRARRRIAKGCGLAKVAEPWGEKGGGGIKKRKGKPREKKETRDRGGQEADRAQTLLGPQWAGQSAPFHGWEEVECPGEGGAALDGGDAGTCICLHLY